MTIKNTWKNRRNKVMKKMTLYKILTLVIIITSLIHFPCSLTVEAYYSGGGLKSEEVSLFLKHPQYAAKAKECADDALEKANELYKSYVLYMGNGDAFRHAYWSALMTKKTSRDFAYKAGLAHEGLTPDYKWNKRTDDQKMDISNNYSGRIVGDSMKNSKDKKICKRLKDDCTNGKLKRILQYVGKKQKGAYVQGGVWVKKVPYYKPTNDGGLKKK